MKHLKNYVAVVTGASSLIGQAVVAELVKSDLKVVAMARNLGKLEDNVSSLPEKLQSNFYPYKCDVTNRKKVKKAFKWIEKELGGTDILVNNAEIIHNGRIIDMKPKHLNAVLNTNIKGLVYCTQAAYKSMTNRDVDGHLVHISNILKHQRNQLQPLSDLNLYTATREAVKAINEIIRVELRSLGSGIRTTSVSPEISALESDTDSPDRVKNQLKPEDIAKAVVFAISQPRHVQVNKITVKPVGDTL